MGEEHLDVAGIIRAIARIEALQDMITGCSTEECGDGYVIATSISVSPVWLNAYLENTKNGLESLL